MMELLEKQSENSVAFVIVQACNWSAAERVSALTWMMLSRAPSFRND